MDKISISSWSLHRELPNIRQNKKSGIISLEEFPEICIRDFEVKAVELCQMHFLSTEKEYIERIKNVLDSWKMRIVNIPIDIVSASDVEKNENNIEIIKRWFAIAKRLGSPSIRVNACKGFSEKDLESAIKGYKKIIEVANDTGVHVLIENHGGITKDPENIIKIFDAVNSKSLKACPDFGNFSPDKRYYGLEKLADYAELAHVKTYEFDDLGYEKNIDIERCINILKKKSFSGYYSIEFEGEGNQREGIRRTLDLLTRYY